MVNNPRWRRGVRDVFFHGVDDFFNGCFAAEAMAGKVSGRVRKIKAGSANKPVQKIYIIGLQPLEAFCNRHVNVFAVVADLAPTIGRHMVAKLGGQEDLRSFSVSQ